jgi:hypothetical protein
LGAAVIPVKFLFSKPEQARCEKAENPKCETYFVIPGRCFVFNELLSGLKVAFDV